MKIIKISIPIEPRTKKNSSRIVVNNGFKKIIPSKAFLKFQKDCKYFLKPLMIEYPINLKCLFYMKTKRKIDLNNLLSSITDVLVHYNVLVDDNKDIIVGFDGSRVLYDKKNPRVELEIEAQGEVK